MIPQPIVLGLTLCEKIIVEEGTKTVSLIGCFTKLGMDSFPTPPERVCLFAALTDGLGEGTIDLLITRLETGEVIASNRSRVRFVDRLSTLRLMFRLKVLFPAPGKYQFAIWLDGQWLSHTVFHVFRKDQA